MEEVTGSSPVGSTVNSQLKEEMMLIDRTKVTPMSIVDEGLSFASLFGKSEPECLAREIFTRSGAHGTWKPISMAEASRFEESRWLPDFVNAGLLELTDGEYQITDLLIEVLDAQAGKTNLENFVHGRFREMEDKLFARLRQE